MGSIAIEPSTAVPSSERVEPGSFPLISAKLPTVDDSSPVDVDDVAAKWVEAFNKSIGSADLSAISEVFLDESYWRDQLCLSWDMHTLHGPQKIVELLKKSEKGCRIKSLALDKSSHIRSPKTAKLGIEAKIPNVQAFLTVKTDVGNGQGLVRLVNQDGQWKAFILFTFLKELTGFEEISGRKRPLGAEHGGHTSKQNWLDKRKTEESFESEEPTVLIVGAGQAGLCSAARLKMLGIKSLIVDREERIGDNWRSRYHRLCLHDAVWFDHLPYLSFPETWPIFTPKDKLGDWFESYVKLLDLNAWVRTTLVKSSWDDASGNWTVSLERKIGDSIETRVVHPKHVILATGHSGEANFPIINGMSSFKGKLFHSSKFLGATPIEEKKRAVIVGCCNSGHDIAQDLYENGYDVTMVQRSTTLVLNSETNLMHMSELYGEGSPQTADADVINWSTPLPVVKTLNIDMTKIQEKEDSATLRGLEKAGFKLDSGPDKSGLWIKYLQRGGGYYIDVGCSQLIIDGKIKVKQGCEISEIVPDGVVFSDGQKLEADEIIFATGYQNMRTQARTIFGDELAERVKDVWGLDEEGELRTMWRKSGHPGFWFMGGNLAMCRWFSRTLALQIKGLEEGLYKYDEL
ncbi:FAD/NAD(P)-binding domain-containing protein [Mollisia scopiformis]|uniref:FAD/NAD(P)-binding domain-containing protein n=1 Tax=Mollisia scopiformis TaxID=149040 RepID=A0A194X8V5_MOLSC|nr:FAD/NAD(P)-binding domain-containing protein [Mollisia scopiformis]KUJ16603.1 FAD/NAD(P)-binding domain-containing protein [Mollisia scopiformis]